MTIFKPLDLLCMACGMDFDEDKNRLRDCSLQAMELPPGVFVALDQIEMTNRVAALTAACAIMSPYSELDNIRAKLEDLKAWDTADPKPPGLGDGMP